MKHQGIHIKTGACALIGNTILKKSHCLTRKGALASADGTAQSTAVLAR
ncbi:hypothetical protein KM92DES2_12728 [uncultured Desulfovibrio sp.]|uniref:Uncharacterized protein n=1 Tax=uncultured Desulfovibrio sp. TaxID=167968 RepID=A0A212KCZ2_9BACT|nr:hypothetical protein KM92DES2_12728 [uncultured Desulfovibrio sp.]